MKLSKTMTRALGMLTRGQAFQSDFFKEEPGVFSYIPASTLKGLDTRGLCTREYSKHHSYVVATITEAGREAHREFSQEKPKKAKTKAKSSRTNTGLEILCILKADESTMQKRFDERRQISMGRCLYEINKDMVARGEMKRTLETIRRHLLALVKEGLIVRAFHGAEYYYTREGKNLYLKFMEQLRLEHKAQEERLVSTLHRLGNGHCRGVVRNNYTLEELTITGVDAWLLEDLFKKAGIEIEGGE